MRQAFKESEGVKNFGQVKGPAGAVRLTLESIGWKAVSYCVWSGRSDHPYGGVRWDLSETCPVTMLKVIRKDIGEVIQEKNR